MLDESGKDQRLTTDILRHSIAFKGDSSRVFSEAIAEIKMLALHSNSLFPPNYFPSVRESRPETSIRITPDSYFFDGKLSQAEAATIIVLLNEASALCQSFAVDWKTSNKLHEALGLKEGDWQSDAIEGFSEFGDMLGWAAGIRERILREGKEPQLKTIGDHAIKGWWDKFAEPVRQDGMILGENTAEAIVEAVGEFAERDIPRNPEGAKNQEEIRARIRSKKHGARLAKDLYLETLSFASRELSLNVGPKVVRQSTPLLAGK